MVTPGGAPHTADWRNKDWVIREVDRCAYGREEQKPTKFLTNRPKWDPKGRSRERQVDNDGFRKQTDRWQLWASQWEG